MPLIPPGTTGQQPPPPVHYTQLLKCKIRGGERYIQVWAHGNGRVPFPSIITLWGGRTLWAINWRWGERRSLASHYTLTTAYTQQPKQTWRWSFLFPYFSCFEYIQATNCIGFVPVVQEFTYLTIVQMHQNVWRQRWRPEACSVVKLLA